MIALRRASLYGTPDHEPPQTKRAPLSELRRAPLYGAPHAGAPHPEGGFTFVELLVVSTILLILASAVMPLAKVSVQRIREEELRRDLRDMRNAIDKFKDAADAGVIAPTELKAGAENYPPDLQTLVDGVTLNNDQSGRKLKFLRRIPIDPMTHSAEWGLRSYQDKPDSTSWSGGNVFDVYTKSDGKALDGTKYKDW